MDTPVLLAFHGLRGVGKDTTIQFARDWAAKSDPAPSVVRRGFADKMKWAYMRMWVPDCTMEWAINFIDQYKNDPEATCARLGRMCTATAKASPAGERRLAAVLHPACQLP